MRKQRIAFGPGASSLILIAVVLALSVLTVLTMISARTDEALSLRSVETRQEVYGLFAQGERSLAKLDAVLVRAGKDHPAAADYLAAVGESLPEGMRMQHDQVLWEEKTGERTLECAVRLNAPGEEPRAVWTLHRLSEADIWEEDEFDSFADFGDADFGEEAEDGENFGAEEDGGDEAGGSNGEETAQGEDDA